MSLELKKRYQKIVYTLKHKIAYLAVEKQLRGKNTLRGFLHDMDKPFLYMNLWLKLENIQKIHRQRSKHHVRNNLLKTKEDLLDTIIDWECARITKPDKPLNAYETLMKFYPDKKDDFLPLIREYLPHQIIQACQKQQFETKTKHLRFDNCKTAEQINETAVTCFKSKHQER